MEYSTISWMDYVNLFPSFVSLDISKTSTGWVKWVNGELTYGIYSIRATKDDLTAQRREFRTFIKELMGKETYQYLFIEKPIAANNFQTAVTLFPLNVIPDDLRDDGVIFAEELIRPDNQEWKKFLRQATNYEPAIVGYKDEKQQVRDCLYILGFGDKTTQTIPEDVYDALGIAIGLAYQLKVKQAPIHKKPLRTNLEKGYRCKQYENPTKALTYATKKGLPIIPMVVSTFKQAKKEVKRYVEEKQSDQFVFLLTIPTNSIGTYALKKKLRLTYETSYLVFF